MASEGNKGKVIETALRLFNSRGCKGVTMDDIAQSMRMSKRTLYEQFANKEELLTECLNLVHEKTNEMHRHAHSQVDEPLLVAMYMLRANAMFIHRYNRILEETERYYPDIHDRFFRLHSDSLRGMLRKGMDYMTARNYMRPDADVEVAIDFFCSTIQRKRLSEVPDGEGYARQLNEVCFTYLRGLMSTDTICRYDQQEAHFRQVTEELNAIYNQQENKNKE
ncbi:MAG: TetR/AcrR family transcriptional regulator [Bacteroidales bacterium]|nr:TetR/AcrR family transcriptional regulator [Bacteroidales bacterium]